MASIHQAARQGNLRELQQWIAAGIPVDSYDHQHHTPLMAACMSSEAGVEVIGYLLDQGADVNALTPPAVLEEPATPHRISLLCLACKCASFEKLELLIERGADVAFQSDQGYTPMIYAAYAERADVLELLHAAGASADDVTQYGESTLSTLSRTARFEIIDKLLALGADPSPLKWSPLHLAAATGSMKELATCLAEGGDLEAKDGWERSAFLLAVDAGSIEKAKYLLDHGANLNATGRCGKSAVFYPIENDDVEMLRWLLNQGCSVESQNDFEDRPIMEAIEHDSLACFECLVEMGADHQRPDKYGDPLIRKATSTTIIKRLIELGHDPASLEAEELRKWIGLGTIDEMPITKEQFEQDRTRRFGISNPETMEVPFWRAMVRCGWCGYRAAARFGDDTCNREKPVWSHDRFGMSLTVLPDGRFVQIAGEHEDGYDPDFCIYNDVIIHDGKGGFEILGYPEEVFPPTDFHSATLVGDWIYIIGNLSYPATRARFAGHAPVFRWHTATHVIEPVHTWGADPGWVSSHRAVRDENRIVVSGGFIFGTNSEGQHTKDPLPGSYALDLRTGEWTRLG